MKIQILSDLHIELEPFMPSQAGADVVILAGDIANGTEGISWARNAFPGQEIIYVPGNHEFYNLERLETLAEMRNAAQKCGIHLLDNEPVVLKDIRFLGCTLWTDFCLFGENLKDRMMHYGRDGLNDFRLIRESDGRFSPERSVELHKESLAWLEQSLAAPFAGKTVVVTHHLPSMKSVEPRFRNSALSPCFASNLDHLLGRMALWVHGHTHSNFDYVANGTRVICNPRGYVIRNAAENPQFNPNLVVEH